MKKEAKILLGILAVVVIGIYIGSKYYRADIQKAPTADPEITEQLIRPDSPSIGPADAKVTVVEFYDPECESCAAFAPRVKSLIAEFPQVRFVYRYAAFHKNGKPAAIFTEAAGEQGKYWEMQETLFKRQSEWGEKHGAPATGAEPPVETYFYKYANELGLNEDQLKAAVISPKYAEKVDRDMKDVRSLGVTRTPTFYVNGRKLARLDIDDLRNLINSELKN